jgi:hypothetical protein
VRPPDRAVPALSRVDVTDAALRPRFDEVRRPARALPSIGHTWSRRSPEPTLAGAVPTLAPWNAARHPEPSPFVSASEAAPRASNRATASRQTPAAAPPVRTAERSTGWLDRIWSGGTYIKTDRYADPFEEFQVCHVPAP